MIETGLIAARFVHYAALALLFGSWAYAGFGRGDGVLHKRFRRLAIWSAAAVLISSAAVLAATAAGLGGSLDALADMDLCSTVIQETDFGRIWVARLVLALLTIVAALAWTGQPGQSSRLIGLLIAGGLVVTVAWTGHAAVEEGAAGQLHRWSDALHLMAAAVWIGVFAPLLWLVSSSDRASAAARQLTRFHAIGIGAVLTLIITGVVNSIFLVGTPGALLTTTYGQLLTFKLALFVGMLGLAGGNRRLHAPALLAAATSGASPEASMAALRRSVRTELALGLLVLFVVAILGAIEPAASA